MAGLLLVASLAPVPARAIPCLSGFVTDPQGNPVDDVDLDFTDSFTGVRLVTPNDNTDETGFYNVCVLPGTYDVSFAPPPGTRLMGQLIPAIALTTDPGLELDVQLEAGTVVTGVVRSTAGQLLGDVDVDVDIVGGARIYTPDDDSDPATGTWRVVVPDGLYRFRFEPPVGSRWRGAEVDSILVAGDRTLDVTLEAGVLLSGRVTEPDGAAATDVDIDLRDGVTGEKIFLANNSTDEAGDYTVAAPTGTFELRFEPPRGSPYVAVRVPDYVIAGDQVRDQQLETGSRVSVIVRDPDGLPVVGADIDVERPTTGEVVFTPHDDTDATGTAVAVLPAGSYRIEVEPPVGSLLGPAVAENVVVSGDRTVELQLPEATRVTATGRLVDGGGTGVAGARFTAAILPGNEPVAIPDSLSEADGSFALALPFGDYDIAIAPPRGARQLPLRIEGVPARQDTSWGEIVLADGFLADIVVQDDRGRPVAAAELVFVESGSGTTVTTPWNTTDADGAARIALPSGTFRLTVRPPAGSGLAGAVIEQLEIAGDIARTIELATDGATDAVTVLANQPNPFNAATTVRYALAADATVAVDVYDLRGRRVAELERATRPAGVHDLEWDGRRPDGRALPAGTYILRIQSSIGDATHKLALVR
jgi:hypothetical protein